MKKILFLCLITVISGCAESSRELVQYVNPFIGTDGHGHTFPGATLPFGMVQLSPDTRKDSWDGCSGYHYSDRTIMGFSHTHLSGTGVGDYGDIRFMPITGELMLLPGNEEQPQSGYRSGFSHSTEQARPGYYKVYLDDYGIDVELTATPRCGFHRYSFPEGQTAHIIIDLFESVTSDIVLESEVEIISDTEIRGFRRTKGWAEDQVVFFHAEFSSPFDSAGIGMEGEAVAGLPSAKGTNLQAYVTYENTKKTVVKVKVGISAVSLEGAKRNLDEGIPGWDFKKIANKARDLWENELSKVSVKTPDTDNKVKFYTSLYHAFIAPNLFSDVDGAYRGHDGKIHYADGRDVYTVFSLWDTYRALHPLMTILQPGRTNDFVATLIDIYQKGGLLPVWELAGNETFCMIGYHAVPVIVDAVVKGYDGFDYHLAYEAMKNSAEEDLFGLPAYRSFGYIPAEEEGESVSKTLEYAYDDWCIAVMARIMDDEEGYRKYSQRSQYYKNLFDPTTGFIRGKRNGSFVEPFDPSEVNFMLTEANTWQYTFYMPQDIQGMIELMGGAEEFSSRLDQLFNASSSLSGRQQADITGLIGQYAHGNEPSHHVAYLYNYAGKPYKTQKMVRQIMDDLYGAGPDGLCGNEDCGQMSAWFVLSAMGFYPVTPGDAQYAIGSPLFDEVSIELPGKRNFTIKAVNNTPQNPYIQSASFNEAPYHRSYIDHKMLMEGGVMEFQMASLPSDSWGTSPDDIPVSSVTDYLITPVPYFNAPGRTFRDEISVTIGHVYPEAKLQYHIGDPRSGRAFQVYMDTLKRRSSFSIVAKASVDSLAESMTAQATYKEIDHTWSVRLKYPYSSQYTGGGDLALIDGEKGGANFRTGGWQGYHGTDFEAVVDLGRNRVMSSITARFLDDQNSWIFLPEEVEISVSDKPYDFKVVALINNQILESGRPEIREFQRTGLPLSARYVKVSAKSIGICPPWHKGAGEKAWLFIDEIEME